MFYKFQKYLGYKWSARNEYSLHSPFMFDLYNAVFKKARKHDERYVSIETLRKTLLRDNSILRVTDLGAGSLSNRSNERTLASIVRNTSKKAKYVRFISLLAQTLDCKNIVELGTSMGISTAYLAKGNPSATVVTIEGCPEIHQKAKENFQTLQLHNTMALQGSFDEVLPGLLEQMGGYDLLYIDGNHTYEATLRYFEWGLQYRHNNSVIIFDDIYWSEGMTNAWKKIIENEKVTASVDVFEFGIVFFRKELSKQHFVLRL